MRALRRVALLKRREEARRRKGKEEEKIENQVENELENQERRSIGKRVNEQQGFGR